MIPFVESEICNACKRRFSENELIAYIPEKNVSICLDCITVIPYPKIEHRIVLTELEKSVLLNTAD